MNPVQPRFSGVYVLDRSQMERYDTARAFCLAQFDVKPDVLHVHFADRSMLEHHKMAEALAGRLALYAMTGDSGALKNTSGLFKISDTRGIVLTDGHTSDFTTFSPRLQKLDQKTADEKDDVVKGILKDSSSSVLL